MTDRDLLELAAKASGYTRYEYVENDYRDGRKVNGCYDSLMEECWNPLTDDGDALRLAVSLMEFEPYKSRGFLPCISNNAEATRRAIVRAAAEIGKAMP